MNLPSRVRSLALASVPLPRFSYDSRTKCGYCAGGETGACEQGLRTKRPCGRSRHQVRAVCGHRNHQLKSRLGYEKNPAAMRGFDMAQIHLWWVPVILLYQHFREARYPFFLNLMINNISNSVYSHAVSKSAIG